MSSQRRSTIYADGPAGALIVLAPVSGAAAALADVGDPVFAEAMLGSGVAVRADLAGPVLAPVDGVVAAAQSHALVLRTAAGREVLVHLGLDARAAPRAVHPDVGAHVLAGEAIGYWDPQVAVAVGGQTWCPVVVLHATSDEVELVTEPGQPVVAGTPVLRVPPFALGGGPVRV